MRGLENPQAKKMRLSKRMCTGEGCLRHVPRLVMAISHRLRFPRTFVGKMRGRERHAAKGVCRRGGGFEPCSVITQQQPLESVLDKAFDTRRQGWLKVELRVSWRRCASQQACAAGNKTLPSSGGVAQRRVP